MKQVEVPTSYTGKHPSQTGRKKSFRKFYFFWYLVPPCWNVIGGFLVALCGGRVQLEMLLRLGLF